MATTGLTDAKINGIKPPTSGQAEYPDAIVPGLRLRVGKSGAKTFTLRKRIGGRVRNITLGRYHPSRFTLADARKLARNYLIDIDAGRDPSAKRRAEKRSGVAAGTVRALFADYVAAKAKGDKGTRTLGEVEQIFTKHVLPEIGDMQADAVTRQDLTQLIDKIAEQTPGAARSVHARVRAFYTWAMPALARLEANPATYARRPGPAPARERTLDEAELRALWKATGAEGYPWRAAVKLLILTGQRRDEVFNADRAEFDLEEATWTIPAARQKNGVASIVPLSPAAVKVLEAVPEIAGSDKLFPASRGAGHTGPSGFSKLMLRLRAAVEKEMGRPVEHWQLHDLRRTLATGLQRLGTRFEVTEAVLNHVSGSRGGIAGVYQRYDWAKEKREALDAWAAEVARIVAGDGGGNVVPLRGASR